MGIAYFIVMVGVLVFVHELGHYLVARYFDVKILRFSIGIGPKIVSYQKGETEYVICAFPLGGYVQMLGGDFESIEDLPPEDRDRALMMKPIWQRSLVVLAGPFFNIVLPVVIYFVFTMMLTTTPAAVVGDVFSAMPAAEAGLQPGDRIVEIDGVEIDYWYQVIENITPRPGETIELKYERDGKITTTSLVPEPKTESDFLGLHERSYGLIGIHPGTYGPTLGITDLEGPAGMAGLRSFDRVVSIDGKLIKRFDEVEAAVRASNGTPLKFQVFRKQQIPVDYARFYSQQTITVTIEPVKTGDNWVAGIHNAEMVLSNVEIDSPAANAGLLPGDYITGVNGTSFSNWRLLAQQIHSEMTATVVKRSENGESTTDFEIPFKVSYLRDNKPHETTLTPIVTKLDKQDYYQLEIGWGHIRDIIQPDEVPFPFFKRMAYAGEYSVTQTWEYSQMLVLGFVRMAQGRMSLNNVGGPIMIGELAAQAGRAGWDRFLQMMALISINLGVINLLPIPVLDGGQLALFGLEAIKRGPLSFRTRQIAAYVGFVMILFLVVIAFKNDIERQWDNIAHYVNEF